MKKGLLLMLSIILMLTMCKKKEEITTQGLPVVTTHEVMEIGISSAICGGEVTDDGGAEVTARGMCWSTNPDPTITDSFTTDGSGLGSFTSNITELDAGTVYYVRAYATNSNGTSYGIQKIFTTKDQFGVYDFVDLGLPSGSKWATCNVGANSPTEYGNYYAWGEIEPKESYTEENCLTLELEMEDISGNPQYDAARANWGGGWRIPTQEELDELIEVCEWEWTNEGGNDGYRVTGPNGNSIFLPAAGNRYKTMLYGAGTSGLYWGSTPDANSIQNAYCINFLINYFDSDCSRRYYGRSVRPVSGMYITTKGVTGITETSALCGGNVADDGGAAVTAKGICWSTSENPTISDSHTTDGSGTGSFTSNMTGLTMGTTYYVRAYATNIDGTSYGRQKRFTTNGQINGYDFVDLGLSSGLKWATCNVGANSPTEYGNYYAWGEVETKEDYNPGNCITYWQEIGNISGNPQYDAARANWGSTWRVPTREEFGELVEECEWEWTNEGGNNGYRVTGANGNSIFLPAAGLYSRKLLYQANSYGYYWSSLPDESNTLSAYCLMFYSKYYNNSYNDRSCGVSVRAVSD